MSRFSTCCAARRSWSVGRASSTVFGIACGAMFGVTGRTDVQDLVSGILMGLSVGEVLVGVWAVGRELLGKE